MCLTWACGIALTSCRETSRAVTPSCLDITLNVFKAERQVTLLASGLLRCTQLSLFNHKYFYASFLSSTPHLSCCIHSFCSNLFLFFLTRPLFFFFCLSCGAGGLQNERRSGDFGGRAVRQRLHASRYCTFLEPIPTDQNNFCST